MKGLIILVLLIIIQSCQKKIQEGYCVGKVYIPQHYENVPHSYLVGKTIVSYTRREKKESEFIVGIANMELLEKIHVDSLQYQSFEKGKHYWLNNYRPN